MATWVTLNGGSGWALQLDGVIYRTGSVGCGCADMGGMRLADAAGGVGLRADT